MSKGIKKNDLKSFKDYIESNRAEIDGYATAVKYGYNLNFNVYTPGGTQIKPIELKTNSQNPQLVASMTQLQTMMSQQQMNAWDEMIDNPALLQSQYDLLDGAWPANYDEVVVQVDENNEISDFMLYQMGLLDPAQIEQMISDVLMSKEVESNVKSWTFNDLLNLKFKLVIGADMFAKQDAGLYSKITDTDAINKVINDKAIDLKVVGIIRPNPDVTASSLNGAIGYTHQLSEELVKRIDQSDVVLAQESDESKNILTGEPLPQGETAALDMVYQQLGRADLDTPNSISIYPKSFDSKDKITEFITKYNDEKEKAGLTDQVIEYTDTIALLMSSISTIIGFISIVLIAFVSISLVVSSIMIGIITYISVLERTKEIGVLRSIGASKKDIGRVFNAETLLIGFAAGIFGIGATLLLNIPVNIIINNLADVKNISQLPWVGAVALIVISMILTLIAGLIPSSVASRKDPVIALRTE